MFMKESVQDEFEQNCFAYLDQLYRLAYARVGNTQDAEDIVQETFIKAFRAKEQFQGRATVRSWLIQILLNTIKDHLRKRQRMVSTVELTDALTDSSSRQNLEPASTAPGPEQQLADQEIDAELQRALRAIPENFLIPLLLREIYDAPYEEIAQILNIPPGTVMSRISRARAMLRKKLGDKIGKGDSSNEVQ